MIRKAIVILAAALELADIVLEVRRARRNWNRPVTCWQCGQRLSREHLERHLKDAHDTRLYFSRRVYCRLTCHGGSEAGLCRCDSPADCELEAKAIVEDHLGR